MSRLSVDKDSFVMSVRRRFRPQRNKYGQYAMKNS
jgi:hypothetical protein